MTQTQVTLNGIIAGTIWMPQATGAKTFRLSADDFLYSDGSAPTLRDMVLRATNDGDFQNASIIDASVTIKRTVAGSTGHTTHTRHFDIRMFPSVSDCVADLYSDEYYAGLDCFAEEED